MKRKSLNVLENFLKKNYIENPKMQSPNMSGAIRDLLTDILHLGDKHDVFIKQRLEDASEVYDLENVNSDKKADYHFQTQAFLTAVRKQA